MHDTCTAHVEVLMQETKKIVLLELYCNILLKSVALEVVRGTLMIWRF